MYTLEFLGTCEQVERTVCLNEELNITCVDQDGLHQWAVPALGCSQTIVPTLAVGTVFQCGNASVVKVEGGSRLTVTADSSLDGATVVCRDANTIVDAVIDVTGM